MSGQNSMFRKVSLDRLSSPEQLDQKITLVSPLGWIAVASLAVLILAAVTWGYLGIIYNKVAGSGVLMYSDGIVRITSHTGGQVADVSVRAGDFVEKGQIIARVTQDDLVRQIERVKENIACLETMNVETLDLDIGLSGIEIYSEFSRLAGEVRSARIQYEEQIAEGGEIKTFSEYIRGANNQRDNNQTATNQTGDHAFFLAEQFAHHQQVLRQDYLRRLEVLQTEYSEKSVIKAEFSGIISGLTVQPFDFLQAGNVLGNIVRGGLAAGSSNVILYVPLDKGKLVESGMKVNVSPATVNREEHGYILGQVVSVSASSVTQEHMMSTLQNLQLVQAFGRESAVIEVEVELFREGNTASGYQWSTPMGAPFVISPGTVCGGEILVSNQRPVDMVVPFIKRLFQ